MWRVLTTFGPTNKTATTSSKNNQQTPLPQPDISCIGKPKRSKAVVDCGPHQSTLKTNRQPQQQKVSKIVTIFDIYF